MPHVLRSALVPYTAKQMYELVDNILEYPQFLPWCRSTQVLQQEGNEVTACIEMAKGSFNKSFTTQNTLVPNERIEMHLVDGPFKSLEGSWHFQALNESACKVSLDLTFEFSNRLAAMVVGPVFNTIANTLVDSFVQRARQVYGKH